MDTYIREQITELRHTLHACPEISGQEADARDVTGIFEGAYQPGTQ